MGIESVDAASGSVIAHENRVAHRAEIGRSLRHAPRRVQGTLQGKVAEQYTPGCEGVHEAALRFVQGSVGDPNGFSSIRSRDGLNTVRRKVIGDLRVREVIGTPVHEIEI